MAALQNKTYIVLAVFLIWMGVSRVWFRGIVAEEMFLFAQFCLGAILGWILPQLDHLIYCIAFPHELTPIRVNELVKNGKYTEALGVLSQTTSERKNLVLHSIVFQFAFAALGFLVVTSSGSEIGRGLVISGLLNFLVWDFERLKRGETNQIFWQIRREITGGEARVAIGLLTIVFILLAILSF